MSSRIDFSSLRRMPELEIAHVLLLRHIMNVDIGKRDYYGREAGQRPALLWQKPRLEVPELKPPQSTLLWLLLLDMSTRFVGKPDYFFFSPPGDYAPEVAAALHEAYMEPQASTFAEALAQFGSPYPDDWDARYRDGHGKFNKPGSEFRERVASILQRFGSLKDFRAQIDDYIRRTPELAQWMEAGRSEITDDDRFRWLVHRLFIDEAENMLVEIKSWPRPYQMLYLLRYFEAEMLNGGVEQFFQNSSGASAPEVAKALREVGLPRHAEAVEKGIAMFPDRYPVDTEQRRSFMRTETGATEQERENWSNRLNALTADVDDGEISNRMLDLAKRENILPY